MVIAVIGDTTLDVTVRPAGPMVAGADTPAEITLGVGGQGANVAVRLARRGLQVRLVTALASDTEDAGAQIIRSRLRDEEIQLAPLPTDGTALVIALIDPAGERTMFSDRHAVAGEFAPLLAGAEWIHVSGYLLRDQREAAALTAAVRTLDPRPRLSVAGGSFRAANHVEVFRSSLRSLSPDLVVLSRDEASAVLGELAGTTDLRAVAVELAASGRLAIVTDGARGSAAAAGWLETPIEMPPGDLGAPPLEATGAGDAYLAALIECLSRQAWPPDADAVQGAMERASKLGALVAGVAGAQGRVAGEVDTHDR